MDDNVSQKKKKKKVNMTDNKNDEIGNPANNKDNAANNNNKKKRKQIVYLALAVILLCIIGTCIYYYTRQDKDDNEKQEVQKQEAKNIYDWDEILESGKLVVTMTRGIDSYEEIDDTVMGIQLALVQSFADDNGLELQVNLAEDTTQMINILKEKNADIIATLVPTTVIDSAELTSAGSKDSVSHLSWAIRNNQPKFEKVLNEWYSDALRDSLENVMIQCLRKRHEVRKQSIPPYISLEDDVISIYDEHFKANADMAGWDWHLIAALCYEESGFDPNAISGAGARGLMQIMPATAEKYNVKEYLAPRENIELGCKIIAALNEDFKDITGKERIKYVIAAYNGGSAHVRDAMALAQKNGKNPKNWDDVSFYILHLKEPAYYHDPIVKDGFLLGDETANHVVKVLSRWKQYVGDIGMSIPNLIEIEPQTAVLANDTARIISPNANTNNKADFSQKVVTGNAGNKNNTTNRFTKNTVILGPNDSRLSIKGEEEDTI